MWIFYLKTLGNSTDLHTTQGIPCNMNYIFFKLFLCFESLLLLLKSYWFWTNNMQRIKVCNSCGFLVIVLQFYDKSHLNCSGKLILQNLIVDNRQTEWQRLQKLETGDNALRHHIKPNHPDITVLLSASWFASPVCSHPHWFTFLSRAKLVLLSQPISLPEPQKSYFYNPKYPHNTLLRNGVKAMWYEYSNSIVTLL